MSNNNTTPCNQLQRALKLLLPPNHKKRDRLTLKKFLAGPTPTDWEPLIQLIIQIVLGLLENLDKNQPQPQPDPDDIFAPLRTVAVKIALTTIAPETLHANLPPLIQAIRAVTDQMPDPGFQTMREAREALRLATNAALEKSVEHWYPWNIAIRRALDDLAFKDQLTTEHEYKAAWEQIATALATIN